MRVLWLVSDYVKFDNSSTKGGYNGGGWVTGLLDAVTKYTDVEVGIAYLSKKSHQPQMRDGVKYYAIEEVTHTILQKIRNHLWGYKYSLLKCYNQSISNVISDFNPELIHLFGLETKMAGFILFETVPIVVHIQGILNPCLNAYFPPGCSLSTFMWPPSIREWVINNGFRLRLNTNRKRVEVERILFNKMQFCMGRTEWDKMLCKLFAPSAQYFHVDEVIRPVFMEYSCKWSKKNNGKMVLTTTSSATSYKGVDLILKTANILLQYTDLNFEWRVIGIEEKSPVVKAMERWLKLKSKNICISYLGVLDASNICMLLLETDIYVHPSYIENSPNSLCEAQVLGVPVVATNVGGVSSLIDHRKNGILVPANGAFELASIIQEMSKDDMLCETIGKNAALTALERHNLEKIAKHLMYTYNSIVKNENI